MGDGGLKTVLVWYHIGFCIIRAKLEIFCGNSKISESDGFDIVKRSQLALELNKQRVFDEKHSA
jgi:hypothetical protein